MELLTQLLNALWAQDFETLANPSMIGMLYFVLFMILFLENGLLPAAFLPGDSLLVLVGVLIAKGAMGFPQTLLLLTVAASLGCWVSLYSGTMAGQHAYCTKLAVASARALSSARSPFVP
ncbi:Inner membrane protein YqjA [Citrobacter koseri]|uniref:Inner membrane protein YqjA n=1 Tax=Citrobacter koseri TaxID=545 RepID=A0A3S4JQC1_CITKO|nr:Inner membrane protein YqjA [Citrobacter koseri]